MADLALSLKERQNIASKEWKRRNKEKVATATKLYRQQNPEKHRISNAKWASENKASRLANGRRYYTRKIKAMPIWANDKKIESYYESSNALGMLTGEFYHVDHIVPLKSKIVCGLHCEYNLQILPAIINIKKGNRVWPDMP